MKRYRLEYSQRASRDLIELYDWLMGQSSPFVADRFVAGLRGFCESLQSAPMRGNVDCFSPRPLRRIGYKRTVTIVFSVENDTVRILRLLYRGRDLQRANLR